MKRGSFNDILKQNPYPGLFIDIEGPDGCGASTQINLLKRWFFVKNIRVFNTKEPTDNIIGGLIRGVLTGVYQLSPGALQLLFVADRLHHVQREITPVLKQRAAILLADRFLWSTIAFGGIDLEREWLLGLHKDCYVPDITILLKVPSKTATNRLKKDRFSLQLFEVSKKDRAIWKNYEWLASKFRRNIFVVDSEQEPEKVFQDILDIFLKNRKFVRITKR